MSVELTPEVIKAAKGRGFVINKDGEHFATKIASTGGMFTPDQLDAVSEFARIFGDGRIYSTVRGAAIIPGIDYDKFDDVLDYLANHGLEQAPNGPHVRIANTCKGSFCSRGLYDTTELSSELFDRYCRERKDDVYPSKFKMSVSGCPINCAKTDICDLGIEGRHDMSTGEKKTAYRVYVGGRAGAKTVLGTAFPRLIQREELISLIDRTLEWYKDNGHKGERIGATLGRVGFDKFFADLGFEPAQ